MAKRLKKIRPTTLVVQFLVPVYDRAGKPYPRSVHKHLRADLEHHFGGWSLAAKGPLPGAWRNPATGAVEYDDSWRYEIGLLADRLDELDRYLALLSHRLGQAAIWRVLYQAGAGKVIPARAPEPGDPR